MNPKELKKLTAKWDQKLAEAGFEDIEDRETGMLHPWSGSSIGTLYPDGGPPMTSIKGRSKVYKESQAEYYRIAAQCLHKPGFPKGLQRKLWADHVNGLPLRVIGERHGMSKALVQYYIDTLRAKWLGLYTGFQKSKKR